MESQSTADTAVRANRVGLLLTGFIPGSGLAHIVFGFEHERAGRADTDAVSTVHAGRFWKRNIGFGRNMCIESTPGHRNRECVLRVGAAGFDTLVAENA